MGTVKLAAKLPDDRDLNGLDHWLHHLKNRPAEQLMIVGYLDTQKLITDFEKGSVQPVAQIVAIEVVGTAIDGPDAVRAAFLAAHDRRTSKPEPLFNVGDTEPAEPVQLAITDGVDIEAAMQQGEVVDAVVVDAFGPLCLCGHSWGDHDVEDQHCTVTEEAADSDGVVSERTCPCGTYTGQATTGAVQGGDSNE